ncbi:MAG: hypothetical protein ACLFU8_00395 [Anaerolineales bacterium]
MGVPRYNQSMLDHATNSQRSQERDRLSILLAVLLTGATLFRFVELPAFTWSVRQILGSPLGFTLDGNWLLPCMLMGLVATGTYALVQSHPAHQEEGSTQERPLLFSLITPSLAALFTSLLLIRAASWPVWLGSLALTGLVVGLLIHLSYRALFLEQPGYASARTALNIINYLLGFVLFGMLMGARERALVTGPVILLLSTLLALDLLSTSGAETLLVLLFAGIIALIESQMAWVLSYWPISHWGAATVLTLGLYVGAGLGYQYLLHRLSRRMLVEFGALALAVFALVLIVRP